MGDARSGPLEFASPYELALLRAALAEGGDTEEAARSWLAFHKDGAGLDGLESGSRRLLPLVYRNAKAFLPSELRGELRRIHIEYWAANQKRLRRLAELLAWFHSEGIPTMVLKGMALSVLHYRDMAVRPTSDFDILVPERQARDAMAMLEREGWVTEYYFPDAPKNDYFFRLIHGVSFKRDSEELDLHWHVLYDATFENADRAFWNESVPITVNAVASRALNPAHQLLHACVHGYAANVDVAPIRWIADAVTVLRTGPVEWTRLLTQSRELRLTVPMHATLSFIRTTFSAPIPPEVLDELASVPVKRAEKRYFQRLAKAEIDWRGIAADNLERNRRANRTRHPLLRIVTLFRQFQLHYNLPRLTDLGAFWLSLLGKQIHKRLKQT